MCRVKSKEDNAPTRTRARTRDRRTLRPTRTQERSTSGDLGGEIVIVICAISYRVITRNERFLYHTSRVFRPFAFRFGRLVHLDLGMIVKETLGCRVERRRRRARPFAFVVYTSSAWLDKVCRKFQHAVRRWQHGRGGAQPCRCDIFIDPTHAWGEQWQGRVHIWRAQLRGVIGLEERRVRN